MLLLLLGLGVAEAEAGILILPPLLWLGVILSEVVVDGVIDTDTKAVLKRLDDGVPEGDFDSDGVAVPLALALAREAVAVALPLAPIGLVEELAVAALLPVAVATGERETIPDLVGVMEDEGVGHREAPPTAAADVESPGRAATSPPPSSHDSRQTCAVLTKDGIGAGTATRAPLALTRSRRLASPEPPALTAEAGARIQPVKDEPEPTEGAWTVTRRASSVAQAALNPLSPAPLTPTATAAPAMTSAALLASQR